MEIKVGGEKAPQRVVIYDVNGNALVNSTGVQVQGPAAENAAAAGNPVLLGGRYDASPRTLGDGDVGAVALDASGKLQLAATVTGSNTVQDDAGNTNTQAKGDDQGAQYVRQVGQGPVTPQRLPLDLQIGGSGFTTAAQFSAHDYLAEELIVTPDRANTDAETLWGDVSAQRQSIPKGTPFRVKGPVLLPNLYGKAHTTAADKLNVLALLADRPDYREMLIRSIRNLNGGYWPINERSGSSLADAGKYQLNLSLTGATLGRAGVFGFAADLDGVNDALYINRPIERIAVATVTVVKTNGSATIDDSSAPFTAAVRDGKHMVAVYDRDNGRMLHGYIGTADVDGDNTKVNVYSTAARSTQNWYEGGSTSFSVSASSYDLWAYKEHLSPTAAWALGCCFQPDDVATAQGVASRCHSGAQELSSKDMLRLEITAAGVLKGSVWNTSNTEFAATGATLLKAGRWYFAVLVWVPGSSLTLYLDGKQEAQNTASIPSTLADGRHHLIWGARNQGSGSISTADGWLNARVAHPFILLGQPNVNLIETLYELSRR